MDDPTRPSASRPSTLPRPQSKLPVPRTNSLRATPSRESLTASSSAGGLRNSKLRPAPSRDRLSLSTSNPAPPPAPAPAASRTLSHRPSQNRLSTRQPASTPRKTTAPNTSTARNPSGPSQHTPSASRSTFPRSLGARKPSLQRLASPPIRNDSPPVASPGTSSSPGLRPAPTLLEDDGDTDPEEASRRSLADRTVETLAQLPSSPALKGRVSSFYDPDSARRNVHSRPGSSHQSDVSIRTPSRTPSRPGSRPDISSPPASGGDEAAFRSASNPQKRTLLGASLGLARPGVSRDVSPSPEKAVQEVASPKAASPKAANPKAGSRMVASQTAAPRPVRPKPSPGKKAAARKISSASRGSSATSCEGATNGSSASSVSASTADSSIEVPALSAKKSSAALREQIAKAKAAKRAAASDGAPQQEPNNGSAPLIPTDTSFDFGLHSDPFGQHRDDHSTAKILQGRVASARTSGRLNIAAMGLKEIPREVLDMYSLEAVGTTDGAWAESVDLTRFVAADNELEMLDDSLFPDVDQEDMADDAPACMFGGLETLDLHGNMLIALPMGMRRLSLLTSLNLSQNRLANNCLEVIARITSLKDLKLGGNLFYGPLDPCFSGLANLEILDLHGNNIASLPSNFGNLSRLRILNLSENCLETLPFEILSTLPLTELVARKNQLSGALIEGDVSAFPTLQSLDVSANQLTHLVSAGARTPEMPALHQLFVSMNRLQGLPDMGSWTGLVTLSADENNINAVPEGMTSLQKLRSVDFSSNDIRIIPPEVSWMDTLAMLRLSGNPLRDKKFCSIGTEEIKSILAARLDPPPSYDALEEAAAAENDKTPRATTPSDTLLPRREPEDQDDSRSDLDDFATPPTSAPHSPCRSRSHTLTGSASTWPVKPGGVLDRSNTQSSALHPVICSKLVAAGTVVREVQLHHNLFTALPDSLSFFADTLTSLSLAHNKLVGETFLGGPSGNEDLDLPALKELNLTSNHITSLAPLAVHLRAPLLQKLDVSFNRVAALPPGSQLRDAFPQLSVLLISNNHLIDLDPATVRGLRILDAANNDVAHLNPRLGLLGGPGGLERLEVAGNRFRVPRWNVLERGTEATLRWLRGRVPVAEMAAWRDAEGIAEGDDQEED